VAANTATVVLELIDALLRRGELVALLRGVLKMRPNKAEVTELVRSIAPEAFVPVNTAGLVGRVTQGLDKLADSSLDASVWGLVGEFRADFRGAASQAKILAGYKSLHDGLHNLQMRIPSVEAAAPKFATDLGQYKLLAREVIHLKSQARNSHKVAAGLPTRNLEELWIDELSQAADEIDEILKLKDTVRMGRCVSTLQQLLQELYRIDGQLASAVAEIPLESLITALGKIAGQLGTDVVATDVLSARDALSSIRSQLEGLVVEHNEWQWLNKSLTGIDSNPGFRPDEKVFGWTRVKKRVLALSQAFAAEAWSVDLLALIDRWEKVAEAGKVAESEQAAVQVNTLVSIRFYDVDVNLLQFSEQLAKIGDPITKLLRNPTHVHG